MARIKVPIAVIDNAGNVASGATVRIENRSDGLLAPVYETEGGLVQLVNPLQTDANGKVQAWVEAGAYRAKISGSGLTDYEEEFDSFPYGTVPKETFVDLSTGSFPSNPTYGDKVITFQPGNETVWNFIYAPNGGGDSWPWKFSGGNALIGNDTTAVTTSSTTFVAGSPTTPTVTALLSGFYLIEMEYRIYGTPSAAFIWDVGYSINGGTTQTLGSHAAASQGGSTFTQLARKSTFDILGANATVAFRYKILNVNSNVADRYIHLTPLAVTG